MEAEIEAVYESLPEEDKAKVQQEIISLGGFGKPPEPIVGALWLIVVGGLMLLLLGGFGALIWLTRDGVETQVVLPIVTAALTAIVGLLVPSPVSQKVG